MSLQELPPELVGKILDHLGWSSIELFSRTCRRNYALALPYLRREIALLSLNGRTLRPQVADLGECLSEAASVIVVSPNPEESVGVTIRGRCPACDMKDFERDHETGEALIHEILEKCQPGRLRKFTWLLGVCVQEDILGTNGILATQQSDLEELRLITCYHRLGLRCQTRYLDLTPFANLRTLSWTGVHRSQFGVVEAALAALANQLVTLELDYLSSTANRDAEADQATEPGYLTTFFLGLRSQDTSVVFPRLENLSFTNIVLETTMGGQLGAALNLHRLKSLTLKQCPGWKTLLASMQNPLAKPPFPLRRLEVHSFPREDDRDSAVATALASALRLCPDLEELRVYKVSGTASFPDTGVLQQDVKLPALRRLVMHEGSPLTGSLADWRLPGDASEMFGIAEHNLLSHSRVEFLGHAGPMEQVKTLLDESTCPEALSNLKVLHVRQDHEEVSDFESRALGRAVHDGGALGRQDTWRMLTPEAYRFATWVFSTPKLASLRLLAFGDFGTFDQRFRLLLCRSGVSGEHFRLVRETDGEMVELLEVFLDSMVVGPSYSRPYLRTSGASIAANVWRRGLGRRLAKESGRRRPTRPREMEGE